jgi:hypothetical protein
MGLFIVLTRFLYQRGSSESKDPDEKEPVDDDPRKARKQGKNVPWPVAHGGIALKIYSSSLTIALAILFLASFALHALGGARAHNQEAVLHGQQTVTALGYLTTAQFWFESFQNWQSEFLSIGILIVLAIFLRQRGSPQSKPVAAPHAETGE